MNSFDFDLSGLPTALFILFLLVGLVLILFWIFQFANLMRLEDDQLPGQYARFGWIAAFLVLWPFAPFAFLLWNTGPRRRKGRHDGS